MSWRYEWGIWSNWTLAVGLQSSFRMSQCFFWKNIEIVQHEHDGTCRSRDIHQQNSGAQKQYRIFVYKYLPAFTHFFCELELNQSVLSSIITTNHELSIINNSHQQPSNVINNHQLSSVIINNHQFSYQ